MQERFSCDNCRVERQKDLVRGTKDVTGCCECHADDNEAGPALDEIVSCQPCGRNEDLAEQVKAIKEAMQENVDKVQETSRLLQARSKECSTQAEQLEAARKESVELHQRFEKATTECSQKSETIAGLKMQLESGSIRSSLEEEVEALKAQLKEVSGVSDALAKERSALFDKLSGLENQFSSRTESDSESRARIADLELKLSTATKESADWQQRAKRHVTDLVAVKKQLADLQASKPASP